MWQPSVLETYEEQRLNYLDNMTGPMRQKYPNSMADRELITSLTKVTIQCLLMKWLNHIGVHIKVTISWNWYHLFCVCLSLTKCWRKKVGFAKQFQLNVISFSLFSAGCVVQCLWERYCYCEYLFWRLNSVRYYITDKNDITISVLNLTKNYCLPRIWEVTKNDLDGLHLWLWRLLWTLPRLQLRFLCWDYLLVLN